MFSVLEKNCNTAKMWFRAARSMCERKRDFLWVSIMKHSVLWRSVQNTAYAW